jgi:DNA-binding NarL/FixJ family response regulator
MSDVSRGSAGTSLLVLDPVRLSRENLVAALSREPMVVSAEGVAGRDDAVELLRDRHFTVVLVSMVRTGSVAVCRDVVSAAAPTPVIALAVPCCDADVISCAEAGVAGYLLEDDCHDELLRAVDAAGRGDVWCPPRVAAMLMRRMGPGGRNGSAPTPTGRLTSREREILRLIDEGLSNKDIARQLSIEVRTVKNHVHNLLEKLQVHRRGEAAALVRGRTDATLI